DVALRIPGPERANRLQDLGLLRTHRPGAEARRRLHRHEREELEEVVRDHVAQSAGRVIELAAPLDIEGLGNGDLNVVDVISIPQRLEYAVRESKHHDVLNGLLSEIVVDAIDLALGQHAKYLAIERLRRGQIGAEPLLDDDAPPAPVGFADETGVP